MISSLGKEGIHLISVSPMARHRTTVGMTGILEDLWHLDWPNLKCSHSVLKFQEVMILRCDFFKRHTGVVGTHVHSAARI